MLILLVILIVERVLLGLILLWVVQLYHELQIYKRLSLCLLQKLSMLQQLKLERRWFGYMVSKMNWVRSRRWAFYIVTVRVQSFLLKIWLFIQSRSIYKQSTTFIRYLVEDKLVILEKICGSKNPADMLTKGVTIEKLKLCAASIGFLAWGQEDEL